MLEGFLGTNARGLIQSTGTRGETEIETMPPPPPRPHTHTHKLFVVRPASLT